MDRKLKGKVLSLFVVEVKSVVVIVQGALPRSAAGGGSELPSELPWESDTAV